MSERLLKINEQLRVEVGLIIRTDLEFPHEALVTVTRAQVSPTLEHATIYISAYPDNTATSVLKILEKNIWAIQQRLNKRLVMRPVPKIRFVLDHTEEQAAHIEQVIEEVVG